MGVTAHEMLSPLRQGLSHSGGQEHWREVARLFPDSRQGPYLRSSQSGVPRLLSPSSLGETSLSNSQDVHCISEKKSVVFEPYFAPCPRDKEVLLSNSRHTGMYGQTSSAPVQIWGVPSRTTPCSCAHSSQAGPLRSMKGPGPPRGTLAPRVH